MPTIEEIIIAISVIIAHILSDPTLTLLFIKLLIIGIVVWLFEDVPGVVLAIIKSTSVGIAVYEGLRQLSSASGAP